MSNQSETKRKRTRPALSPDARENQLIAAAVDLAEKQILAGTASSQVITHFLQLGSSKAKLEKENLKKDEELKDAKIEALHGAKSVEELYSKALEAMRRYSGNTDDDGTH